ncbi:MAG: flagellar motor switch protein FliM [bacterium]
MAADALSQNEIDSLLSEISTGEVDVEKIQQQNKEKQIKNYDFRRPDKLSKEQMRTLEMVYDNFVRILTTNISTQLRSIVEFNIGSIEQVSYEEFTRSLPAPTIIGVCGLKPFEGRFILEMSPEIGFTMIDRIFGGIGETFGVSRSFTDIEETVLKTILGWFLDGFPEAWENIVRVEPKLEELESNPQFTQIVSNNNMIVLITIEAKIGKTEGLINLCIPYIMIEPIVPKLNAQQWFSTFKSEQTTSHKENLEKNIRKADLKVNAELGDAILTITDLINLVEGDVIKLNQHKDNNVNIRIENKVKYTGIIGTKNNKMAIKVTDVIKEDFEEEGDL